MTSADKSQKAQEIAKEGKLLVSKAEILLQNLVLRNARLSHELKQAKVELEIKLAQKNS